MITAGICSALALLFLLFKLDFRKLIKHDFLLDVTFTLFLMWLFAGTFAGMMAAIVGGLIISVVLFIAKRTMRREEIGVIKVKRFPYRKVGWKDVYPR